MRLLAFACLLLVAQRGLAHDHNLATFTVYQAQGVWLLKVDFPTQSVANSLQQEGVEWSANEQTRKEAVVRYLKAHTRLSMDGETAVEIGEGGIKLGDHSSEVIFTLPNFHTDWIALKCTIDCFRDNSAQSNLLRVKLHDSNTLKTFLTANNSFGAALEQVRFDVGK